MVVESISYNLNLSLNYFCPPRTTCKNMLLMICYENIVDIAIAQQTTIITTITTIPSLKALILR